MAHASGSRALVDVAQRTRELGKGAWTYAVVRATTSDGSDARGSAKEYEAIARAAVRTVHGSVDGGFEFEVLGAEAGRLNGDATFVVRVRSEHWKKLWSALTMAGRGNEGESTRAYDVLASGASLQAVALAR